MVAVCSVQTKAQMSSYDKNEPIGWAVATGEVTGAGDVPYDTVTVTTASELRTYLNTASTRNYLILIDGEIEVSSLISISGRSNKTIIGLPGSALVNSTHTSSTSGTGILRLANCNNIIIRNVTFKGAGAYDIDGNDNLHLQGSTNIWVDHCDFQDGVDGNFDITNGSDSISVTWCRFRYFIEPWAGGSGGSDDHRYCTLIGGSDSNASQDETHLNITFANCWWDEGCRERMPRVRFGKVHVLNCLYSSSVSNYCVGGGYKSNVYIENSTFVDQSRPWRNYATSGSYTDYNYTITGCSGASDAQGRSGSIEYFIPSDYYTYSPMAVDLVQTEVGTYAGATLTVDENGNIASAIKSVATGDAEIVSTSYYNMSGMMLSHPQKGLNIIRHKMSDGTVKTIKVIIR